VVDFEAGAGDGAQQLGHLGALEDLVDRDPAEGQGNGGFGEFGRIGRDLGGVEVGVEAIAFHKRGALGLVARNSCLSLLPSRMRAT
jgi:hypothetical protein